MGIFDRYALSVGATGAFLALLAGTVAGCGQHATGALPAPPSLVQPMSAHKVKAGAVSQSDKVNFPTPVYLGQGNPIEDLAPSVALITPSKAVEENTKNGKLVYRIGNVSDINNVAWSPSVTNGDGDYPSIASDGASTVVDVHSTSGHLAYRFGTLAKDSIAWGSSNPYETGKKPHVAFSGTSNIVEVHDGANGYVYSILGQADATKQTVTFGPTSKYDAGHDPSVVADATGDVIELHKGSSLYGYSHLYYHVGKIDVKSKKIDWPKTSTEVPGTFSSPSSIAWSPQGYLVIAYVCEGAKPFNFYYLCTTMGSLGADKTITWFGKAQSYLGDFPTTISVALNGDWGIAATGYPSLVEYAPSIMKYSTSLLSDRSNWERDRLDKSLNGKTLHQIVFPASHDSGMYADVFGGVYAEALAQDENLYGQLSGGQRYLDLRPDNYDGDLHFYHGLQGAPIEGPLVQSGLNDVAKYMKEGHREAVILKFSHFDFDDPFSQWYGKLLSMVETTLGPWLYENKTGKRLADIPLRDLIASKGIVIPVMDVGYPTGTKGIYTYRDWQSQEGPQTGQITAFDRWSNSDDYETMKTDQLDKYATFDGKMKYAPTAPCDFFLLSWTLTPIAKVWSVAPIADARLGPVSAKMSRNNYGQIPNILYVDFYEWADPADVAIRMNERL